MRKFSAQKIMWDAGKIYRSQYFCLIWQAEGEPVAQY